MNSIRLIGLRVWMGWLPEEQAIDVEVLRHVATRATWRCIWEDSI